MKKILIILLTIPLIFNSCKKEDDSPNTSILGTWELEDYTTTVTEGYIDPVLLTETVTSTEENTMNNDPLEIFWVYRDDGTFSEYYVENGTIEDYDHYDYVKNGDEVSISDEGETFATWIVTSLTSNNLNISVENESSYDGGNDTTYFFRSITLGFFIKSQLPDFTTELLNKKKPINGYKSFLNRRN